VNQLRPDQIEDLALLISNPKFMLLNEPGTGKTPTACVYTEYLVTRMNMGVIWLQPLSIMEKNRDELIKWTGLRCAMVTTNDVPDDVDVLLMGPERFRRVWQDIPKRFKAIIGDEWHMMFGGATSARTTALFDFMRRQGTHVLPMTGTLINGKLDTAFPAVQLIEPRYYGDYSQFCNYHHDVDPWTGKLAGYRNHQKLRSIMLQHGQRRTFEDVYGPEAKIIQIESVSLLPAQREMYETFEEQAYLELEKFVIDGTLPGTAFIRSRQILEHPNNFPDLTNPKAPPIDILAGEISGKEERLEIHFQDHLNTGEPLVVFSALMPQQRRILEQANRMGLRFRLINSTVLPSERARIDEQFRAGALDGIVCSPQCASVGFNWQLLNGKEIEHVIFASIDFMDTSFIQAYRRFIRGKRQRPLRITMLRYRDTIEDRIYQIVEQKSQEAYLVDETRPVLELS
jgi:hypothetical protein